MKTKSRYLVGLILIIGILVLSGCDQQTKYVCPDGTVISDPSLCPKEEKIQFSIGEFNPKWYIYPGYECYKLNKLTIQASTYDGLKNVYSKVPSKAYIDCYFKVGENYIKESVLADDPDANVGDFDTSEDYSVTLCCTIKTDEGKELSEERCKTEYIEAIC